MVGDGLVSRAVWPEGAEPAAPPAALAGPGVADTARLLRVSQVARAAGVYHQGDMLGAITLEKARSDPVSAAEDKLLTDLASQAGLALRNVRLTAELRATIDALRASRRRLVRAQDDERQRIERNLHDGAQQQLVALSVGLAVLDAAADDPEQVRELAGSCATACAPPSTTCARWRGGSTRRCLPIAASRRRCARRPTARPRPCTSTPTASGGCPARPRRRCTSACLRLCRTSRSTRRRR